MGNAKTGLSQATTYEESGEFWDSHGLDGVWNQTREVAVAVESVPEAALTLSPPMQPRLHVVAARQGMAAQELLESWLQERLEREAA